MPHSHRESIADLMTPEQARKFRADHDSDAKALSRQTKAQLVSIAGHRGVHSRNLSKDELVSALIDARYPLARLHEALHVLHHTADFGSSACDWCHPHNGGRCDCSRKITLADHTGSAIEKILGA